MRALTVKGATSSQCCRSSVVERILGKAEVVSSILTGSTIFSRSQSGGLARMKIKRRPAQGMAKRKIPR